MYVSDAYEKCDNEYAKIFAYDNALFVTSMLAVFLLLENDANNLFPNGFAPV